MGKSIVAALGLIVAVSTGHAQAAPLSSIPAVSTDHAIVQVRDGCGPGWYRTGWQDRWGRWRSRCVPFRRW